MTTWNWIALGAMLFGNFIAVVGVYVKIRVGMAKMESDLNHCKEDFKLHEQQNERTFSSVEKKIDTLMSKLDGLISKLI